MAPRETYQLIGQINIFEAIREARPGRPGRVLGEYGRSCRPEVPIRDQPCGRCRRTRSPRSRRTIATYFASYGLRAIRRAANHTDRGAVFVTSSFARQVARIEAGLQPGDRVAQPRFGARLHRRARPCARTGWRLPGKPAGHNIATGQGITIRALLDKLLALSKIKVTVEVDPDRLRPSDVEVLLGDSSKFRADTGWEPKIPFDTTVRDLLDYWRDRVKKG